MRRPVLQLLALGSLALRVDAAVEVHGLQPIAIKTQASLAPVPTGGFFDGTHTFDNTMLLTTIPDGVVHQLSLKLQNSPEGVAGLQLSVPQKATFLGFSIEMSVVTQLIGPSSGFVKVPFLNLMANVEKRAGSIRIRVGGNTQEIASYRESLEGGVSMAKEKRPGADVTTETPAVLYTDEMFRMFLSISTLVHVQWFLGIPFNQTQATGGFRLDMIHRAEAIMGDSVVGFQAGNEPDLYVGTSKHRQDPYGPSDYMAEFQELVDVIASDSAIPRKNILLGPSIAHPIDPWIVPMAQDFVPHFKDSVSIVTVETYPDNNCAVQFKNPNKDLWKNPQQQLSKYTSHGAVANLVAQYEGLSKAALAADRPLMMFETNTASCGGFAGISNTFVSALWTLDYAFEMARQNFSGAMLHVGGQSTFYNPFTAPPTNQAAFHQWTVGPIFYSVLAVAEAFGISNTSRVVGMFESDSSPAYAIYENGVASRLALINYLSDASGANDVQFTFEVGGSTLGQPNGTPPSVKVKYLTAGPGGLMTRENITWAGQTFGAKLSSDGIIKGDLDIVTITCNADNTCTIPVKAPQFALVFLTDAALAESSIESDALTFATTAITDVKNTATVDQAVLETSNGQTGKDRARLAGTSKSESSGMSIRALIPAASLLFAAVFGGLLILLPTRN